MLTPGLVSVTFRPLSRSAVATLMKDCGLAAIEWGGDVHVPASDPEAIRDALRVSAEKKISIVSYGSYYCADVSTEESTATFAAQLACTVALGAPNIRIWAGGKGSAEASADERKAFTEDVRHVCTMAAAQNRTVSLECHGNSLTDTCDSALRLFHDVAADNLRLYWQPNQYRDDAYNLSSVQRMLPYISNVHVFSWSGKERYPLERHENLWRKYIEILQEDNVNRNLLLEFVCDDTPAQLHRDAETLLRWLYI